MSVVGHLVVLSQLLPCTYFVLSVVVKGGLLNHLWNTSEE